MKSAYNDNVYNLHTTPEMIRLINLKKMRWAEHS
jgi:hypothetical protein